MKTLYLKNSISDNPKISKDTILLGPVSVQRTGGIKHTLDSLFSKPDHPTKEVCSFLNIALAVFAADKLVQRSFSEDVWTRNIRISVPVSKTTLPAKKIVTACLSFLTGDEWSVQFRPSKLRKLGRCFYKDNFEPDAVCLFSGGLDSLIGAVNLLEDNQKLILLGHHDYSLTASVQKALYVLLSQYYGNDQVRLEQFEVKILNATEDTTRSRSFLFIMLALAVASSFGKHIPVYIPENGFMGINAPLTSGRLGSYSTRTTHPLYLDMLKSSLLASDIPYDLINPYRHLSKGNTLHQCKNKRLLKKLYLQTISCAHPTAGRWKGFGAGNCGYCFPCLVRRSSLNTVGLDDPNDYLYDSIGNSTVLEEGGRKAVDLQSVLLGVYKYMNHQSNPITEVLKAGSLGTHGFELFQYASAFQNGISEISDLIQQKGCPTLKRFIGL